MSSLISLIVEFLASVGATIKARQQSRATEELPRGEAEIKAIGDDVAAIKTELAKLAEPPLPSPPTKPEQPVKLPS
jgi:predicted mannosyl-3-phosphoglycerate phosphatase (HAD superfamily)